ncbi:hypothetical protein GQ53DRAFT_471906 [Thozetella sp. PMI_491]|nr:hypothetical protein GQ53DRAFT_471906 [Thozetella sp. PMI_491]
MEDGLGPKTEDSSRGAAQRDMRVASRWRRGWVLGAHAALRPTKAGGRGGRELETNNQRPRKGGY